VPIVFPKSFFKKKYLNNSEFTFLNQKKTFQDIDWNYLSYGKLWNYNLNYFNYLEESDLLKEDGLILINDYILKSSNIKCGLDPYPTSLRIINWIKFISKNKIFDENIDLFIYNDLMALRKNLEFHLLGNHLLENAFSLLFGAYYFRDENIYRRSKKILTRELNEQILNDGGHFELSPMYHQIIIYKLIDCIQLIEFNEWKKDDLLLILKQKASNMLSWLDMITYKNGSIPLLNDSANDIAPPSESIFSYAKTLNISWGNTNLSDSGYRKWNDKNTEIIMDIGQIGPDYIPSHAHADTFNFEFYYKKNPIIVDSSISTYEKNSKRQLDRSTKSHNTISIDELNSSEVWAGFRVAKRAKVNIIKETKNLIEASHSGFKEIGAEHKRKFKKFDGLFVVEDYINSKKNHKIESYLHFHPNCDIVHSENILMINSELKIIFNDYSDLFLEKYNYNLGFNKIIESKRIRALVNKYSRIEIYYEN
jgi:hypothetical protein